MASNSNPVILITGANTGLGFETIKSLCQSPKPYTILLGGRSIDKANAAVKAAQTEFPNTPSVITSLQVDVEDDNSISQAFEQVAAQYGRLDVLVNNAGGSFDQTHARGEITMREAWNKSWNVNTAGTHILTHTFVPLLLKSSDPRLLFVTSGVSTLTEHENLAIHANKSPAKGWPKAGFSLPAYRSSKTGMNMMMREWARTLREDGVKVWAVSPGLLATGLGGDAELLKRLGAEDPAMGANFVREVVEGAWDSNSGKAIRRSGIQPW